MGSGKLVTVNQFKKEPQSIRKWLDDVFVPFANLENKRRDTKIFTAITTIYQTIYNSEWRLTKNRVMNNETPLHEKMERDNLLKNYYPRLSVLILNFFGFPLKVGIKERKDKLTFSLLIRNLFGLRPENAPTWQKVIAIILSPFTLTWNLLQIVTKTTWNIATLLTEFLPCLVEFLCERGMKNLYDGINDEKSRLSKKVLFTALSGFLMLPFLTSKLWRILARTITSPLESMNAALEKGRKLGGLGGEMVGRVLQFLSVAITITVYSVVLPLAVKAVVSKAPAFLSKVGEIVPNWLQTAADRILPAVKGIGNTVMKVIGPILKPAFKLLGITENPVVMSISVGISTLGATVGTYTKHVGLKVKDWWANLSKKEELPKVKTKSNLQTAQTQENSNEESKDRKLSIDPKATNHVLNLKEKKDQTSSLLSAFAGAIKRLIGFESSKPLIMRGVPAETPCDDDKDQTREGLNFNS